MNEKRYIELMIGAVEARIEGSVYSYQDYSPLAGTSYTASETIAKPVLLGYEAERTYWKTQLAECDK